MTKATTPTELKRRRRRKPEAAESEILSAAEDFLRKSPVRELTVDNLMARTTLARPSFYGYFRDRSHLIVRLTERLGKRNRAIAARWLAGHESVSDLRRTMHDLAEFYVSQGHLLRALSDSASSDLTVESGYRRMLDSLIIVTAEKIRTEIEAGAATIKDEDPRELATALLLLNERYFIEKLGRQPQVKARAAADTLLAIWLRVLYGVEQ